MTTKNSVHTFLCNVFLRTIAELRADFRSGALSYKHRSRLGNGTLCTYGDTVGVEIPLIDCEHASGQRRTKESETQIKV